MDNGNAFASACARFVHPGVEGEAEQSRQRRFFATMFSAPFLLAVAAAMPMAFVFGGAVAIAVVCLVLCTGWLIALIAASTGRRLVAEMFALAYATIALATAIAMSGGTNSPFCVLLAALPMEAFLASRCNRGGALGGAAAFVAGAGGFGVAALLDLPAGPHGWFAILPLLYALTLWPRLSNLLSHESAGVKDEATPVLEELIDAAVFRLEGNGDIFGTAGRVEDLLGLSGDLLLGTGFFDRIHIGDRVAYLNALADLRRDVDRCNLYLRIRIATGEGRVEYRPFALEMISVPGTETVTVLLRDDARAARLQALLAEARDRVEESEMTRTRMLASVSHELRTPLNAILGFSDALSNDIFGHVADEKQREYVCLIHEAGRHLLSVVNALLDLSKIESGALSLRPETFNLQDAVRLTTALVDDQARARNVMLATRLDSEAGDVHCDRRALQQILINLLSNAVKFTPSGGSVTVLARQADGKLDLEIADTGIGMAKEDLARIGTPFMQVQNEYARQFDGTGLGLSLVKGLVGLQRGGMSVESAPGAGTRVRISLPMGELEEAAETATVENGNDDGAGGFGNGFLKTA